MRIGSLFAGIGGLELGLERAGLGRVVWQVEQARRIAELRGWDRLTGWVEPDLARVDDGVPCQVGAARKAYGNAVVPACAEVVGRAIAQAIGP